MTSTRVRYAKRTTQPDMSDGYDVQVQDAPRRPWRIVGIVCPFGAEHTTWAALGTAADAWTTYRRTRKEAVTDMLAGVTFRTLECRAG